MASPQTMPSQSKNGDGNVWGIQAGEILGFSFTGNYNNVMTALTSGDLKIGLHVQALPKGQSDSYISSTSGNTENTPEPLTMLAAGAAVGFGTMFKKQRDRLKKLNRLSFELVFRSRLDALLIILLEV